MHSFLCKTVSILPLETWLTRRIEKLWSQGMNRFSSGDIATVLVKNSHK